MRAQGGATRATANRRGTLGITARAESAEPNAWSPSGRHRGRNERPPISVSACCEQMDHVHLDRYALPANPGLRNIHLRSCCSALGFIRAAPLGLLLPIPRHRFRRNDCCRGKTNQLTVSLISVSFQPSHPHRLLALLLAWLAAIASIANAQGTDVRFIDDPRLDGWRTEVLQDAINGQWKKLAKILASNQLLTAEKLDEYVTRDMRCARLRANASKVAYRDSALTVKRPSALDDSSPYSGAAGFHRALNELLGDHVSVIEVKFKVFRIQASPTEATTDQFVSIVTKTNVGVRETRAEWRAAWQRPADDAPPRLKSIDILDYEEAESNSPRGTLFSDCTEAVFSKNTCYQQQFAYSLDYWNNRLQRVDSSGMQGCAVGDVNGDGLDDIYVCQSSALPNRLFRHNQDDTVTDVSAQAGVDWHEQTHGALMIDIDNDGDQDLVLGTTVALVLVENDGQGRFAVRARIAAARGAYTLCSADYDLDGDLDIFACIYLAHWRRRQVLAAPVPFHDARNGGRNALLRNEGGWEFSDVTREAGLEPESTRRSFAAAWEDFDNDGDQDLYVANDYGRNNLFRNDQGKFTDVAGLAKVEDQSFGMSGSWSDFNRDGWMDLYVANMFSAAGNRITYQRGFRPDESEAVRQQFQYMARGNSLFQNFRGDRFRDVSSPARIMMGLWSWGSQFVDLNNDGYEDIVVANGYFTRKNPDDL